MQTPEPGSTSDSDAADTAPAWLGRWSFGLAFVSAVAYFASSEGIRNFTAFLLGLAQRIIALGGHGG